jgi:hypothetical protein
VQFKLYHIREQPITFRSYNQLIPRVTSHTPRILSTHVQFKLYRTHEMTSYIQPIASAYIVRFMVRHHAWAFGCVPVGVADPDSHARIRTKYPFVAKYSPITTRKGYIYLKKKLIPKYATQRITDPAKLSGSATPTDTQPNPHTCRPHHVHRLINKNHFRQ